MSNTEERKTGNEVFRVSVLDVRLKREEGSSLPTLRWELRRINHGGEAGEVVWHKQTFEPEQLEEIMRNVSLCGIVCTNEELPAQLIKARGCELEVEMRGNRLVFLQRLDKNVFFGNVEPQQVAEQIPL